MPKALFTINTVVEVLADGALVTDSKNWSLAAAVADDLVNTWLGHIKILGLLNTLHGSLQDFSEDVLRLVLELRLDEVLEGFAVHALVAAVFLGLFTKNLLDGLDWLDVADAVVVLDDRALLALAGDEVGSAPDFAFEALDGSTGDELDAVEAALDDALARKL